MLDCGRMKYRGKSVVGSSLLNTAAGLLSLAAGFGASVIVARLLGVEGSGLVAFALYFMWLSTAVSDGGMSQTVLRFIAGDVAIDGTGGGLFTTLMRRFVVTTTLMAVGILGYALFLYEDGNGSSALIWGATAILFLSYAYSTMALNAAHGLGQMREAAEKTLIGCVIQPLAVFGGAVLAGPAGAILGHALRHFPQALAVRGYLRADDGRRARFTPELWKYARHNWIEYSLTVALGAWAELAILGLSFSFMEVGYYSIGLNMNGLVLQLAIFLLAILIPYLGSLHDSDDHASLVEGYQRSLRWLGIVLAPVCFGGAAIVPVLVPSVFGREFEPAVNISEIMILFSFPAALSFVAGRTMLARRLSGDHMKISIVRGLVSIVLMLALVPIYGALGTAWIKAVLSVATFAFFMWYCRKHLGIPFAALDLVKLIAAGLLCAAAARLCIIWLPNIAGMGLGILAGAAVYVAALFLLSLIRPDERAHVGDWLKGRASVRIEPRSDDDGNSNDASHIIG